MTLIALIDTETPELAGGTIDCLLGLGECARAPSSADFKVRTSGTGLAEIIGLTAVAGRQRNAYRLTVRFALDAGLLSISYLPPAAQSAVVPRSTPPIEVTVVGSDLHSTLASNGAEWHRPVTRPPARQAVSEPSSLTTAQVLSLVARPQQPPVSPVPASAAPQEAVTAAARETTAGRRAGLAPPCEAANGNASPINGAAKAGATALRLADEG